MSLDKPGQSHFGEELEPRPARIMPLAKKVRYTVRIPLMPIIGAPDFGFVVGYMSRKTSTDITLVLNAHDETKYLQRTVASLEESVRHAKSFGLKFELAIVLDQPVPSTEEWLRKQEFNAFDQVVTVKCDHGSLGLARNEGISAATGEYIATCDADDLISFNMFSTLYATAKRSGPKAIVIPQYLLAFGQEKFLVEYYGTDCVSRLGFLTYHPSVSRIFAHRSIFDLSKYVDVGPNSDYAFEDWHFACESIAKGCDFVIGRGTILFYRRRSNSLGRVADRTSVQQIPPTALFAPKKFLSCCARDFVRFKSGEINSKDPKIITQEFTGNPLVEELIRAASKLDPAINTRSHSSLPAYSNLAPPLVGGATYYRICELIERRQFTDVVFAPSYVGGGGNYLLDLIEGIIRLERGRKFLILFTGGSQVDSAAPEQSDDLAIIDLTKAEYKCAESDLQIIALRVLENFAPGGTIHVGTSNFSFGFIEKFYSVLKSYKLIFYRPNEIRTECESAEPAAGEVFNFISEFGENFSFIVAADESTLQHDTTLLNTLANRYIVAPALCRGIASYIDRIS
ncbi:glycosyltransferase family A protein [Methylobacterium sp. 391_Methyba4]|uniref:glycosyltransferase family A protein n=1 Tax=Methylobacterium sp. 391_Methyba4 TaxID=3038924 RepID=UPI00241FE350|nr:glycosyltransferase family A protein [Methylobacterium sp. 391_Methyba4]WFS09118.1 glycosyltransferase family A protein [Methylobacterium sp. 391_Methyba4]